MHRANIMFWKSCKDGYPKYFTNTRVIEFGSYNVNGSVKDFFDEPLEYVGVDWREGPCVDLVKFAHEVVYDHKFDVVISASMLEHDPHWEKSLLNMLEGLSDDGILLLSWGAARNREHELHTACDGLFHALPAGEVLKLLADQNIYVHKFIYESQIFASELPSAGEGEVCLVAFKNSKHAVGEQAIAELFPEDRVSNDKD